MSLSGLVRHTVGVQLNQATLRERQAKSAPQKAWKRTYTMYRKLEKENTHISYLFYCILKNPLSFKTVRVDQPHWKSSLLVLISQALRDDWHSRARPMWLEVVKDAKHGSCVKPIVYVCIIKKGWTTIITIWYYMWLHFNIFFWFDILWSIGIYNQWTSKRTGTYIYI